MELKKYKLGDCLTMIENGAVIKQKKNAGGIPITRIETLSNDRFNRDRLGYADIFDESSYSHFILDDMDLIMSHINSRTFLGRTVIYRKHGDEKIIHGMNVLRLKTDIKVLNPLYAYYYFKTNGFRTAIDHIRKDAINQSSLATSDIKNLEILIPSIEEQSVIVSILDNLDRKIALNRSINQNLEALAKQLYDYWFVQFDFPDENGQPYKSNGGKMVWNEYLKREIPKDWFVANYKELFTIGNGKTMPQIYGVFPAYGGNGKVKDVGESNYGPCIIIGRVGANCGSIHYSKVPCWVSDNAIAVCPIIDSWQPYLYYSLKLFNLAKNKGGSSQPLITHMTLKNLYFPISKEIVEKYACIANCLQNLIHSNQIEIIQLTKQRDKLLPLLMNGQVSLNSDLSNG